MDRMTRSDEITDKEKRKQANEFFEGLKHIDKKAGGKDKVKAGICGVANGEETIALLFGESIGMREIIRGLAEEPIIKLMMLEVIMEGIEK